MCTAKGLCFVNEDQIEQIQKKPCISPVITKEVERSSAMLTGSSCPSASSSIDRWPRFAMFGGGNLPLFLFSVDESIRYFPYSPKVVGRILQWEIVMVVVQMPSFVSANRDEEPK